MLNETEISLPYEKAGYVLFQNQAFFEKNNKFLIFPIGLRPSRGDRFYFSPMFGRSVISLTFFYLDIETKFVEEVLNSLVKCDIRFHSGKTLPKDISKYWENYQELTETKSLTKKYDPKDVFASDFTKKLGLRD